MNRDTLHKYIFGSSDKKCLPAIAHEAEKAMMKAQRVKLGHSMTCYGPGFYLLYYVGDHHPLYNGLSDTQPIYIGKTRSLKRRFADHLKSINNAEGISPADFEVVGVPMNSAMSEACETALIHKYQPLWNTIVSGFGNHAPGKERQNMKSRWDMLHEGREQSGKKIGYSYIVLCMEVIEWCEKRCMLPVWYRGMEHRKECKVLREIIHGSDIEEFYTKMGDAMRSVGDKNRDEDRNEDRDEEGDEDRNEDRDEEGDEDRDEDRDEDSYKSGDEGRDEGGGIQISNCK